MPRVYSEKLLFQRFWEKVEFNPETNCLEWVRDKNEHGYGLVWVKGHKSMQKAHRISWILAFGDIPKGMCVCHECDNPPCVYPGHLFLGTQKDNAIDKVKKGRDNSPFGEGKPNRKLSLKDALAILSSKKGNRELGRMYGVHHKTIGSIKKGVKWRKAILLEFAGARTVEKTLKGKKE